MLRVNEQSQYQICAGYDFPRQSLAQFSVLNTQRIYINVTGSHTFGLHNFIDQDQSRRWWIVAAVVAVISGQQAQKTRKS